MHALTAGVGLLPCPLTISVLGFAWTQGTAAMVSSVLFSLALGISATIAIVAELAIVARNCCLKSSAGARVLQGLAGLAIIAIAVFTIVTSV